MGRSLHREASVRRSAFALSGKVRLLVLFAVLGVISLTAIVLARKSLAPKTIPQNVSSPVRPVEAVAALGRLEPAGDVRKLAAPSGGFGGTPRVAELTVADGEAVNKGQVLAVFENRPKLLADLAGVEARLQTLKIKITMQKREVGRYRQAAAAGASALVLLEEKQDELIRLEGERLEALSERRSLEVDLAKSELKSPVDGVVLRVHSRVGERPGPDGVIEVGASQEMEALIEVYESDINRVRIGQNVRLTSENGGFNGTLKGSVIRISPQVRQRRVLSTDPTGDADARVVEVRVRLTPESASRVSRLAGMKVIARFQPS